MGAAIAALLAEESEDSAIQSVENAGSHRFLVWLFNRLYAAVLGLAVFAVNIAPESFMIAFGSQYRYASGSLSCDNLLEAFAGCILRCVIVIAGMWPLLRERTFLSQRSKWRALLNVAADAFCTMTFVHASLWLTPSDQAYFQLFLRSPLAIMLIWPLGVPAIIASLCLQCQCLQPCHGWQFGSACFSRWSFSVLLSRGPACGTHGGGPGQYLVTNGRRVAGQFLSPAPVGECQTLDGHVVLGSAISSSWV